MGTEEFIHGLFPLATDHDIKMLQKGYRVTGGQRASGNHELAVATQMPCEPQTVLQHSHHAVYTDHLCLYRQGVPKSVAPLQKGAVQQVHVVTRFLQAGSDVTHPERWKPENGPIAEGF